MALCLLSWHGSLICSVTFDKSVGFFENAKLTEGVTCFIACIYRSWRIYSAVCRASCFCNQRTVCENKSHPRFFVRCTEISNIKYDRYFPHEAKNSRKLNRTRDETAELLASRGSLLSSFLKCAAGFICCFVLEVFQVMFCHDTIFY